MVHTSQPRLRLHLCFLPLPSSVVSLARRTRTSGNEAQHLESMLPPISINIKCLLWMETASAFPHDCFGRRSSQGAERHGVGEVSAIEERILVRSLHSQSWWCKAAVIISATSLAAQTGGGRLILDAGSKAFISTSVCGLAEEVVRLNFRVGAAVPGVIGNPNKGAIMPVHQIESSLRHHTDAADEKCGGLR
jgi:NAD(P)-dependent dehydrogenase (short-subunit alcohol dehydrogenase family)